MVFGQVVEGLDVVKKVESYGSGSGKTSQTITIVDAGQLAVSVFALPATLPALRRWQGTAPLQLAALPPLQPGPQTLPPGLNVLHLLPPPPPPSAVNCQQEHRPLLIFCRQLRVSLPATCCG